MFEEMFEEVLFFLVSNSKISIQGANLRIHLIILFITFQGIFLWIKHFMTYVRSTCLKLRAVHSAVSCSVHLIVAVPVYQSKTQKKKQFMAINLMYGERAMEGRWKVRIWIQISNVFCYSFTLAYFDNWFLKIYLIEGESLLPHVGSLIKCPQSQR